MQAFMTRDFDGYYYVDSFAMLYVWGAKDGDYIRLCNHVQNVLDSTTDESIRNKYLYLESKIKEVPYRVESEEKIYVRTNRNNNLKSLGDV